MENKAFHDLTIWIEGHSGTFRLGNVSGCTTERFAPPREVLGATGSYRLVGVYSGRRHSVTSPPVPIVRGAIAVWTIEQSEWLSNVVLR